MPRSSSLRLRIERAAEAELIGKKALAVVVEEEGEEEDDDDEDAATEKTFEEDAATERTYLDSETSSSVSSSARSSLSGALGAVLRTLDQHPRPRRGRASRRVRTGRRRRGARS